MATAITLDFERWSVQDYLDFTSKMGRGEIIEAAESAWKAVVNWDGKTVTHKAKENTEDIIDSLEISDLASLSKTIQSEIVAIVGDIKAIPGYETNVGKWKTKQLRAFQRSLRENNQEALFDLLDEVIVKIPDVEGTPKAKELNFEQFAYLISTVNAGIRDKFSEGN